MSKPRACTLSSGSDMSLVHACRLFEDRLTHFKQVVADFDSLETSPYHQQQATDFLIEWQAIGREIIATPAHHQVGKQAKTNALQALFELMEYSSGSLEEDLARSLISDLLRQE